MRVDRTYAGSGLRFRDGVFGIIRIVALMGLLAPALPARAQGRTVTAASCNQGDVRTAISSAKSGDVVTIPPGACTWTSRIELSKGITLQGGQCSLDSTGRPSSCETVVRDGVARGAMLQWTCEPGRSHRLSGIEFRDGGRTVRETNGIVRIDCVNSSGTVVRIDHMKFDGLNGVNLRPDTVVGVIDHNTFVTTAGKTAIYVYDARWDDNTDTFGDSSWAAPVTWGSESFLFVEDNALTKSSCTDGYRGTRAVFRFNTFINCHVTAHGTESSGRARGSLAVEIYGNEYKMQRDGPRNDILANIRSGSALIWGNSASGLTGGGRAARLNQDRMIHAFRPFGAADGANPWDVNGAGPSESGSATTSAGFTITVKGASWKPNQWRGFSIAKTDCTENCSSVIVGNTSNVITFSNSAGFGENLKFQAGDKFVIRPVLQVLDGVGRSGGMRLSGGGGNNANAPRRAPSKPSPWNNQINFPLYEWLNTNDGNDLDLSLHSSCIGTCRENEHFYNYNPDSKFDGAAGVGVGRVSARPRTCTPGVWYWATDEGEWNAVHQGVDGQAYGCTALNTWKLVYTPFTYPHPLTRDIR